MLVETIGVLGTCEALRGDYARALEHFRDSVKRCEKLGAPADQQHSNLLLNVALLHKSQGDLEEALNACRKALDVYLRFGRKDTRGYACFLCALASLNAARGHFAQTGEQARQLKELCTRLKVTEGPEVVAALHCQALSRLSRKEFTAVRMPGGAKRAPCKT